jgi:hypothetical protein
MNPFIRQVAYARESNLQYYPIWRVDLEINGRPHWCEVQAQTAICAEQMVRRDLSAPPG